MLRLGGRLGLSLAASQPFGSTYSFVRLPEHLMKPLNDPLNSLHSLVVC